MKIQDILPVDYALGHRYPSTHNNTACWSIDQIERIVHHPSLCSDENELLVMVARRIRDERDYRISSSILTAMEIIAGKIQGTS